MAHPQAWCVRSDRGKEIRVTRNNNLAITISGQLDRHVSIIDKSVKSPSLVNNLSSVDNIIFPRQACDLIAEIS